ncbi:hypothetical protein BSL78_20210 [Apostichopus japonicus]|uniref:Ig-like domain-containing protein n=1 Tax=Stichopus japonicus TaxID=307972 RepID=A0A2G8K4J8_STIJA|nr:hypothetical protein BSL78_20210 [Apostichopus japonicus]
MDLSDGIYWVLNNNTSMKDESTMGRHATDRSGSKTYLEISNVKFEDAGFYKCVRYPTDGTSDSKTNRLHVRGDMKVEVDRNFTLHDTITAKCCVRSTKSEIDVPFVWFISNVWSVNDKFGETIDTDIMYCRNISITSERKFHDNFFGCSISPELNVTSKKPINIFHPASVEWIPLTNTPSPIMVDRNQNVIVTCLSDGIPSPSVLLQKKTSKNQWMDLPLIETFWNVTDKYWNFSYNITEETTCTLRCFATNDIGEPSASDVITIEVLVDLMAVILANLKLVVIGCVGFLLLLMVICFLALKKRKRIRYRLSAEANRNATNSTQNQQNFIRRDMPDLCSHEPIASSQIVSKFLIAPGLQLQTSHSLSSMTVQAMGL